MAGLACAGIGSHVNGVWLITLECSVRRMRGRLPEDVRGGPTYIEYLEAAIDPSHDDRQQLLEWCGGSLNRDAFHLAIVNKRRSGFEF